MPEPNRIQKPDGYMTHMKNSPVFRCGMPVVPRSCNVEFAAKSAQALTPIKDTYDGRLFRFRTCAECWPNQATGERCQTVIPKKIRGTFHSPTAS